MHAADAQEARARLKALSGRGLALGLGREDTARSAGDAHEVTVRMPHAAFERPQTEAAPGSDRPLDPRQPPGPTAGGEANGSMAPDQGGEVVGEDLAVVGSIGRYGHRPAPRHQSYVLEVVPSPGFHTVLHVLDRSKALFRRSERDVKVRRNLAIRDRPRSAENGSS